MKSAIQNDVALGIFYQFTRCHRIGHGNTLCKLKETRVFGGFWRTAFFGLKKRWIILIYLIITEIKVIFVMEGRGSYRAREAHRPASLAGYNKIWCAVPPSCRGAAAPLFLCPDSSAAFHAAMARGLMLTPRCDCRSDRGRDGIPFWSQQKKDGNRLAKCRLLPSLLSYLLQCVDFLFYGLGIIKLH